MPWAAIAAVVILVVLGAAVWVWAMSEDEGWYL